MITTFMATTLFVRVEVTAQPLVNRSVFGPFYKGKVESNQTESQTQERRGNPFLCLTRKQRSILGSLTSTSYML